MTSDSEAQRVRRVTAQSGRVDYSAPVIIHSSSRSEIAVVPFYIQHSDHTGLKIKIVPRSPLVGNIFADDDEKALSLTEEATEKLLQFLMQRRALSDQNQRGDFLVLPVTAEADALARVLMSPDLVARLSDSEVRDRLETTLVHAMRLADMHRAVDDLRALLDGDTTAESAYQAWCEAHPWVFGNAYQMPDEVRRITTGDTVDLLLPLVTSGYRDLIELKRPDAQVIGYDDSHRNHYFMADASKAIGQCGRYLDMLHEAARSGLLDHPEIVAYHPRATIVIGRSNEWEPERVRALHGLNSRLSGVSVMTYDQLMAHGERLLAMLEAEEPEIT